MTQGRTAKVRVIALRALGLALTLSAAGWAIALQTGNTQDPCKAKKDYEAAQREAAQTKQAADKIKNPPEASDVFDPDVHKPESQVTLKIASIQDSDGYGGGIQYQGKSTSYRLRL